MRFGNSQVVQKQHHDVFGWLEFCYVFSAVRHVGHVACLKICGIQWPWFCRCWIDWFLERTHCTRGELSWSLTGLLSTDMCPVTEHLKGVPESHCSVINCWELVDNLPYQPMERKVWLKQCHKMHVACLNSGLAVSRSRALRIGEFFSQRLICELIDLSGPHNQSSWDCGLWFELSFSDSFSG